MTKCTGMIIAAAAAALFASSSFAVSSNSASQATKANQNQAEDTCSSGNGCPTKNNQATTANDSSSD